MSDPRQAEAALRDFWAIPADQRFHELIHGVLTEKCAPTGEHGDAQAGIVGAIRSPFHRKPDGTGQGGCWIATEVEVLLNGSHVVRPDVVGWRRENCPARPTGTPVRIKPDWICEVVSPSNANHDTVRKLRLYHDVAVPYYWLADPRDSTLTIMRWSSDGYVTLMRAEASEKIRAEPFEAIEFSVGTLFGIED